MVGGCYSGWCGGGCSDAVQCDDIFRYKAGIGWLFKMVHSGGSRPLLDNVQKKDLFSDCFP